jgi:hypothetical protein
MPGSSNQRPKSVALRGTMIQFESGFWSDEKNYTGVDGDHTRLEARVGFEPEPAIHNT